jgi:hypothetical protein
MVFNKASGVCKSAKTKHWLLVAASLTLLVGGCDRQSLQLSELREENQRLKKALEQARSTVSAPQEVEASLLSNVDLDLTIVELWSQRFEDNQFRAKQRLEQKQIRVTGLVESVSERSVTIYGSGTRFGSVSLVAQLDEAYIKQIAEGLASLRKGVSVTVQGRFLFDKMWLDSATFVDRVTGKRLASKDLAGVSAPEEPVPRPNPALEAGEKHE